MIKLKKLLKEAAMTVDLKKVKMQFPEIVKADVNRTGYGAMDKLEFLVVTDKKWKADDSKRFQNYYGYAPQGYGWYRFKEKNLPSGDFQYTWYCSASSD